MEREIVSGKAVSLGKAFPEAKGYLVGVEMLTIKGQKPSMLLHFQDDKDNPFGVWGTWAINVALLTNAEADKEAEVKKGLLNAWVRLQYVDTKKGKGGRKFKKIRVFVDESKKCKNPIPF